ncbi:copper amine oxidase domain protein [[Eubacterium] yurii subsp. margaretiae ATCC 43715]|nr:copper amine oxidase domain protein [[Eubacterium] yurii subsp. margaretiae ATCC 43715]
MKGSFSMKKIGVIIFGLLMTSFLNNQCSAANHNDITLIINGKRVVLEQNIIIENGRVLVPYSLIAKDLGAVSNWDSSSKKVTVKIEGKLIEIKIGNKTAMINGKAVELDVPPMIRNDRTMIPLRFVAESLNYNVDYDKEKREVSLSPSLYSSSKNSEESFEDITGKESEYSFLKDFFSGQSKEKYTKSINKDGYTYAKVFYGEKNTGGFDAKVESVSLVDGKFHVKSRLTSPPPNASVTMAFSYPSVTIRFKNPSQLPVIFEVQGGDELDINSNLS